MTPLLITRIQVHGGNRSPCGSSVNEKSIFKERRPFHIDLVNTVLDWPGPCEQWIFLGGVLTVNDTSFE